MWTPVSRTTCDQFLMSLSKKVAISCTDSRPGS
jgi:hypothetical protein